MQLNYRLSGLPKEVRIFIASFVVVLSVGFYTGLLFVNETSTASPNGIEENYLGNEQDEDAEIMKFKKSDREMLTIVHTHILSMSLVFFLLGGLVWMTNISDKAKLCLTVEPFLSVILTFGGIYFLWNGVVWMKYVVIISGILMTFSFMLSSIVVLYTLVQKPSPSH
ncbi:hypothetical protein R3X28_12285 [Maribacter sp. TH_r10]|uniref:Uncharacterized protein n=1 Tax=Maribacter luteus TaxID=2594478 RepID=A0A6I2MN69_9FLAO|nr:MULTISPECIES: hypothetical protein [Maribacter]MDV7139663.1 hypothetical protein [Maribacter sp. TH_r10]MRX65168.1 hypothetical protein [Maribacter luteus]